MSTHRVAITGVGMATALGPTTATSWRRLVAGESGIARINYFDASQYGCQVAAQLAELPRDETGLQALPARRCRRSTRAFLAVAREAFVDAALGGAGLDARRIGVAVGTSVNYVNLRLCRQHFALRRPGLAQIDLARATDANVEPPEMFFRRQGDLIGAVAAKALGLGGPNLIIDTACAAGSFAVAEAYRLVRAGRADAMVAGGACAIVSPIAILAFQILGALSTNANPDQASRPFDRRRDGFVMGEGAGAVVLERWDRAVARGARIYGELAGYGMTMNAGTLTDPSNEGSSEARAMQIALGESGLAPADIDYVAAHGTSTPKNDAIETAAIKQVFGGGARRLMVTSNKGQIGHTISAAGICNLVSAMKTFEQGIVPPTANYQEPDPQCDLNYVPRVAQAARVRAALVNAFAFGGQNVVLAVKAA